MKKSNGKTKNVELSVSCELNAWFAEQAKELHMDARELMETALLAGWQLMKRPRGQQFIREAFKRPGVSESQ